MKADLIQTTTKYLFADEKEMNDAKLTAPQQQRLIRLRDMYNFWLRYPKSTELDIVTELKHRYQIKSDTQAYEDVRLIKICLGSMQQVTKEYDRFRFRQVFEEGLVIARKNGDANAIARLLAAYGKNMQLDKAEADAPAYSEIVPETFEVTVDPTELGFPKLENWRDKVAAFERRYEKELANQYVDFEEIDDNKTQQI